MQFNQNINILLNDLDWQKNERKCSLLNVFETFLILLFRH